MTPKGVSTPRTVELLLQIRPSNTQNTGLDLLSGVKGTIRVQHSLDCVRSSGDGGNGVPCSPGMALGPQALLRPLLDSRGEEGVPLDTSEGPCQGLARGSGPYYLKPPPDELFLDSAAAGSESQALSSEVIRLVVETI